MTFFMWLLGKVAAPIFYVAAIIGVFFYWPEVKCPIKLDLSVWMLIVAGLFAVVGAVVGYKGWDVCVSRQFLWRSSKVDLLNTRFANAVDCAFIFALFLFDVWSIIVLCVKYL